LPAFNTTAGEKINADHDLLPRLQGGQLGCGKIAE
jgi:hypothetical protein